MFKIDEETSRDILSNRSIDELINYYGWEVLVDNIEKMISNNKENEKFFKEKNAAEFVLNEIRNQRDLLEQKLKELTTNKD